MGTGTHNTSSNEIQPAEQNTGNPLEVGGKEGDGAPCRGLLRRGCSRARCLRSEHCSLPNGLFLQLVVTVYSANACSAFLNEDCLLWVTTEAFSGLILGNPSRLSGPRSLRGGSYPFAGYPNFCYDWGARAYNESGRYIGKPAHMRSKPAQRVLLRHVVVHYTDGHTTSLGLPFAMGSGLKSDKPTVQYALTGKREYMHGNNTQNQLAFASIDE